MNKEEFMNLYKGNDLISIVLVDEIIFDERKYSVILEDESFEDIAGNGLVKFETGTGKCGRNVIYVYINDYKVDDFIMEFEFDSEKIKKNEALSEDLCYEWLDELCQETRFEKIGKGRYKLNDGEDDLGTLLILSAKFESQSWLLPNLKKWITYSNEGMVDALKEL